MVVSEVLPNEKVLLHSLPHPTSGCLTPCHISGRCMYLQNIPAVNLFSQILPFFSGERSPGYNDDATACVLGLRRSTTRAQLVRAGLESVCLRLAAVVDLMTGGGGECAGGECDGGGGGGGSDPFPRRSRSGADVVTSGNAFAASPFLRQVLADSLGRTVRASGVTEETSLGVAVLLSSLEGQAPRRTSSSAAAAAGLAGGVCAAADVAVPTKAHTASYSEAGLAQKRAYRAIFGTASSVVSASSISMVAER